ncbi:MAG: class I SAM-dependent methyltransferase, partial [Candidatus Dadabacteria bacterium]
MAKSALDKYLFKPFFGSSHTWALGELRKIPKDAFILDIGAGSCGIGEALKKEGYANLWAVEVDKEALKRAQEVYDYAFEKIEDIEKSDFDAILLLDVIEHLQDPSGCLAKALSMLKIGGVMLVVVPNIAHWSVRFPLLFGFFNYSERSILDSTHLHFFTRARFKKMLLSQKSAQLIKIESTIEPFELVFPRWLWNNPIYALLSRLRLFGANLLPGLFAYQHAAVIKKIGTGSVP